MKPNLNNVKQHRKSSSWTLLSDTSGWIMDKERRHRAPHFSLGQAMAFSAICASAAAVLTAMVAVNFFGGVATTNYYSDRILASTSRSIISRTRLRPVTSTTAVGVVPHPAVEAESSSAVEQALIPSASSNLFSSTTTKEDGEVVTSGKTDNNDKTMKVPNAQQEELSKFPMSVLPPPVLNENSPKPYVGWLLSFPNSGTSFTLHNIRESSNCTTATNYALEGDIKDKPSVQAIEGPAGVNGPFLELIPNRHTNIPETIVTKTHCKGFCSGAICGPERTLQTVRSFMVGCLSGKRAVVTNEGLEKVDVTYDRSLVHKAVHLMRHPLDNIVARFHLELKVQGERGNYKFVDQFPRNATGFHRWCAEDDRNRKLISSRLMDNKLREKMREIPCMNDFYRWVQWHNLAFAVSREMNLPTMILHYQEYSLDYEGTRDRILAWFGLPFVGGGEPFQDGKRYRHYYSSEQKMAIRDFLEEVASVETWQQTKDYDFNEVQSAQ